jgi:hypothetical protein
MQLRDDAVVARHDDIRLALMHSALNAGEGEYCAVTVRAANAGYARQGMAIGADCPHVAAMSVQSQSQSSRQRPPFSGHKQYGSLGFTQINYSLGFESYPYLAVRSIVHNLRQNLSRSRRSL